MKEKKEKWYKRLEMPDAFVIIFSIVLLAAVLSYLIPAGTFVREEVDGVTRVIPGSYTYVESNPANVLDLFVSIQKGMIDTANIIFLILIVGGIVKIIEYTGAIDAGINVLIQKTKGRYMVLITLVALTFGILASMGLVANAVIAFVPIGIALARNLKLDAIIGVSMIYLGYYAGMVAGVFDPVVLVFAQTIAELPLFSGMTLRVFIFIGMILSVIIFTNRYAKKVKNDPSKSILGNRPFNDDEGITNIEPPKFTVLHGINLLIFVGYLGFFIWGAFTRSWGINELVGVFLMMGFTVGFVSRISPNQFVKIFIEGARGITYGALVVGLARAVVIILENSQILDTIVNATLVPLQAMPTYIGGLMLFVFNLLFNFLVTSGTGQAAIVMPLMVPITDVIGITRQTGVLAFILGDGITNIVAPTSGVLMAVLAVGGVKWTDWIKFVWPILLSWIVIGTLALLYALVTGYGPY